MPLYWLIRVTCLLPYDLTLLSVVKFHNVQVAVTQGGMSRHLFHCASSAIKYSAAVVVFGERSNITFDTWYKNIDIYYNVWHM